jgi:hypothetical protein
MKKPWGSPLTSTETTLAYNKWLSDVTRGICMGQRAIHVGVQTNRAFWPKQWGIYAKEWGICPQCHINLNDIFKHQTQDRTFTRSNRASAQTNGAPAQTNPQGICANQRGIHALMSR